MSQSPPSDDAQSAANASDVTPPDAGPARRWDSEGFDQPWNIGDAIGVGMSAFWRHFASLVVPGLVVRLIVAVVSGGIGHWLATTLGLIQGLRPRSGPPEILAKLEPEVPRSIVVLGGAAGLLVGVLGGALVMAFLVEANVCAVRDERVKPGRVGRAFGRFGKILVWQLLPIVTILVGVSLVESLFAVIAYVAKGSAAGLSFQGFVEQLPESLESRWSLHVVLGIAALFTAGGYLLKLGWTPFFLVDEGISLRAAMRKSWRTSKHHVGTLFLYVLALGPIALLILVPVIGIVPQAFIWLGLAYGYARATGRNNLPWYTPEFASKSIRKFLSVTLVVLGAIAGGLIFVTKVVLSTTAWSLAHTILHAIAIIASVAVVIVLMALLLPYGLDRLEGRRFTSFVAARHVRSQKSGFLTVISVLSICGVAISSCALSSVRGVMDGFGDDLKRKILGNTAHIVIDTTDATPFADYAATVEAVRAVPGVISATPVVHGEVMASSASNLAGVVVTGIEPGNIDDELRKNIKVGKVDYLEHPELLTRLPANEVIGIGPNGESYYKGAELPPLQDDLDPEVRAILVNTKPERPGIILGLELAKTLHVYVGDEVTLVSPLGDLGPMGIMPRTKRFRVAGIFDSGMYEYDAMSVYMMLEHAQEYFATGDRVTAIDIKVDDVENTGNIAPAVITAASRPELRIRDWREINKNLFSALALERYATSIILSIAILVASFCIICTLLLMVTEKGKEIAILKAIGASDGAILRTFMIEGVIIGGIGMVFGVFTGLALCSGLKWIGLPLPSEVYYIHGLPVRVSAMNFIAVAIAALLITTLSTVYPAYAASKLRPVDGLRYE